jgi:hypothetical protein
MLKMSFSILTSLGILRYLKLDTEQATCEILLCSECYLTLNEAKFSLSYHVLKEC